MEYPQTFIDSVLKLFPDDSDLENALKSGDVSVGTQLLILSQKIRDVTMEWTRIFGKNLKSSNYALTSIKEEQ